MYGDAESLLSYDKLIAFASMNIIYQQGNDFAYNTRVPIILCRPTSRTKIWVQNMVNLEQRTIMFFDLEKNLIYTFFNGKKLSKIKLTMKLVKF